MKTSSETSIKNSTQNSIQNSIQNRTIEDQNRTSHLRISDMAAPCKPIEKAETYGIGVLSDAELIAVILRSGSSKENVINLAERLLNLDPEHPGLIGLNYLTQDKLTSIPGIGRVKAIQLKAVAELSRRMARSRFRDLVTFREPETVADYFREEMRYLEKERVYAAFFDQRAGLLKETMLSEGTVTRALISARDVFKEAISCGATGFILLHNHPSGDVEPSREDRYITSHLYTLGEMMDIHLMDHIIIGKDSFLSFKERGWIHEV